jgi:AcrR family transcriptional regulator
MTMPVNVTLSTRQKILDTASDLFFRLGYRAVGVDMIVKEMGMAKMTLYRHFPSKDDLIVAYLKEVDQQVNEWLDSAISPYHDQPQRQLMAIFEALQELVKSPDCHGCPFLMMATEFPEVDSEGHKFAILHKKSIKTRFENLARQAGCLQPDKLADQLLLLMDGALSAARMFGIDNPGNHVVDAAEILIDAQISNPYHSTGGVPDNNLLKGKLE